MNLTDEQVREQIGQDKRWMRIAAQLTLSQMRLLIELDERRDDVPRPTGSALAI